ncbi:MAG: TIGR03984 family CRISPR-associated protein [Leptospiraceae bacterium]|nr:TIGR03984 family CRISPR-associated protein [Leptospiraceae bacterium]
MKTVTLEKSINGLTLGKTTQGLVETETYKNIDIEEWQKLASEVFLKTTFYFVAYLDYAVIIGKYENEKLFLPHDKELLPKFIQKIRIFNQSKELYIWRTSQNGERVFKGRLREDNSNNSGSKEIEFVQADQVLFGTTSINVNNDFAKLTEDRGTEVVLPFTNINVDNQDKRIAIRTRNYIGYNEIGQAGYVDCRFVEFVKRDKDITYTWDELKKDWIEET